MIDFKEYIRQGEPQKREKGYAWQYCQKFYQAGNMFRCRIP